MRRMSRQIIPLQWMPILALLALSAGCGDDDGPAEAVGDVTDAGGAEVLPDALGDGTSDAPDDSVDAGIPQVISDSFSVRGSVEQIHIWNAEPDTPIEVVDPSGDIVAARTSPNRIMVLETVLVAVEITTALGLLRDPPLMPYTNAPSGVIIMVCGL